MTQLAAIRLILKDNHEKKQLLIDPFDQLHNALLIAVQNNLVDLAA